MRGSLVAAVDGRALPRPVGLEPTAVALGRVAAGLRAVTWVGERLVAVVDLPRMLHGLVQP